MGPVAGISTFPLTMANPMSNDNINGMMSMGTILSSNFWDSMLVPGTFHTFMDRGQGWLIFHQDTWTPWKAWVGALCLGQGGSGIITPFWGQTPIVSTANLPIMGGLPPADFTPQNINTAFNEQNTPLLANSWFDCSDFVLGFQWRCMYQGFFR